MRAPSIIAVLALSLPAFAQDEGEAAPVEEMRLQGSPEAEPEPEPEPAPVTEPEPVQETEPATEEAAAPTQEPEAAAPEDATDDEAPAEPGEEEDPAVKALEARLADQQEEIATLRRQLEESQRQSEQLEEVVTGLDDVELSVDDLHAFERQRAVLEAQHVEALERSVALLAEAGRALYYGSDDVLPELEAAGASLDGEAQRAALVAAELVRRGDLFNARSWVDLAHDLAERSLQAATGLGVADGYP